MQKTIEYSLARALTRNQDLLDAISKVSDQLIRNETLSRHNYDLLLRFVFDNSNTISTVRAKISN